MCAAGPCGFEDAGQFSLTIQAPSTPGAYTNQVTLTSAYAVIPGWSQSTSSTFTVPSALIAGWPLQALVFGSSKALVGVPALSAPVLLLLMIAFGVLGTWADKVASRRDSHAE